MKEYIEQRPMLLCGILSIIVSVASAYYYSLLLIASFIVLVFLFFVIFKALTLKPEKIFVLVVLLALILNIFYSLFNISKIESFDGSSERIKAVVCEVGTAGDSYNRAVIEVANSKMLAKGTKVLIFYDETELNCGQAIEADFKFSKMDENFKLSNYSEKIYLTASIKNITFNKDNDDIILTNTEKVRHYIRTTLFSNMEYKSASILCALILGDRSYLTKDMDRCIRYSGVSHVMVVSGLHLSIFVSFITNICKKFTRNRYFNAVVILLVVIFLSALCGFTMSIKRAGITYIIMALAILLNRQGTPENTLGTAITLILLSSPFAIFNIALQLSMLSTFGILVVALPIINYVKENEIIKSGFVFAFFSNAVISLSAMLMTLPVVIYVFGYISTVSVITNILITLAVTVAICLTLAALAINLISVLLAKPLFILGNLIAKYISFVIEMMGNLKFSVVTVDRNVAFISVLLIIAVLWYLIACKKRLDMIKLEEKRAKILKEGGGKLKWQ